MYPMTTNSKLELNTPMMNSHNRLDVMLADLDSLEKLYKNNFVTDDNNNTKQNSAEAVKFLVTRAQRLLQQFDSYFPFDTLSSDEKERLLAGKANAQQLTFDLLNNPSYKAKESSSKFSVKKATSLASASMQQSECNVLKLLMDEMRKSAQQQRYGTGVVAKNQPPQSESALDPSTSSNKEQVEEQKKDHENQSAEVDDDAGAALKETEADKDSPKDDNTTKVKIIDEETTAVNNSNSKDTNSSSSSKGASTSSAKKNSTVTSNPMRPPYPYYRGLNGVCYPVQPIRLTATPSSTTPAAGSAARSSALGSSLSSRILNPEAYSYVPRPSYLRSVYDPTTPSGRWSALTGGDVEIEPEYSSGPANRSVNPARNSSAYDPYYNEYPEY